MSRAASGRSRIPESTGLEKTAEITESNVTEHHPEKAAERDGGQEQIGMRAGAERDAGQECSSFPARWLVSPVPCHESCSLLCLVGQHSASWSTFGELTVVPGAS